MIRHHLTAVRSWSPQTFIGWAVGIAVTVLELSRGHDLQSASGPGIVSGVVVWGVLDTVHQWRRRRREVAEARASMLARARLAQSTPPPAVPAYDDSGYDDSTKRRLREFRAEREAQAEAMRRTYQEAIDRDDRERP